MMNRPELVEKELKAALFQFLFPFSLNSDCQHDLKRQLKEDGYVPFSLRNLEMETAFYGQGYRVSHVNLERYYLPFTSNVIFPHKLTAEVFQRYSKRLDLDCVMRSQQLSLAMRIHSVDVVLCPFDLGFITVRVELPCDGMTYTRALEFASRFRELQNMKERDYEQRLEADGQSYDEVEEFILKLLVPGMMLYLDKSELKDSYFEKLPFFVDERMYVQGMISFADGSRLTEEDLYRASRVDGMNSQGKPYISSTSMDYIRGYLESHIYDRWAPDTYYVMEETSFFCLTDQPRELTTFLANQMYGEYYYGVLINLFYRIVLLKLSNRYSHVQLDQNPDEIQELIRSITTFSAKYYFLEVISKSQGKEIFIQLRNHLGSDELFADVKKTLLDLYKYQENLTAKRSNYLLLILTIYTVISGIYGMNQVIEDLKGPIDWSKFTSYSVFEYFALAVTFSGIIIALGLGFTTLYRLIKEMRKRR